MKKQYTVRLFLLLGTAVVLFYLHLNHPAPAHSLFPASSEQEASSDRSESIIPPMPLELPQDTTLIPLRNLLYAEPAPEHALGPYRNKKQSKQFVAGVLPSMLEGQEGTSADITDLLGSGPFSVDLRSDWMTKRLLPDQNLPALRMRIIQDPVTKEYRISGGAVALPGTGLEAGYETEFGTDGYKATLQWKKSF